jgi:hypothetical protein
LTGVCTLVMVLALVNVALFQGNAALQAQVSERQVYIQQSLQLEGLYREMVKALAELSAQNSDERLKALLASQGITFNVNQRSATAAAGGQAAAVSPARGR